jgi:NhaP-type Na+/H+ or K+/H+ antiporter
MSFEMLFFIMFAGGWLFGRIFDRLRLPGVLGMTLFGIAISVYMNFGGDPGGVPDWPAGFWDIAPFIKSLALVVILLRAGLGISKSDLQTAGMAAVLMTFIPCLLEGTVLTILFMNLFDFPWQVAGLTAFMLAAVSPAVVVPSMLELQEKGLGKRNGVITVVLAGASADDVFAITLFTMFLGFATGGEEGTLRSLASMPLSLAGGLAAGIALGFLLSWWFRRHHEAIRATEKALLLIASAVFLLQIGEWAHLAALLGVMAAGFVLLERSEVQAHELAAKLGKVWVAAQIALFVIIGMSIDVPTAVSAGPKALLVIVLGLTARSAGVLIATLPSKMTMKERLFCILAYLPKATVQAALGGVALSAGIAEGQVILAVAVLAIVFTAPIGLLAIRISSRRLLA